MKRRDSRSKMRRRRKRRNTQRRVWMIAGVVFGVILLFFAATWTYHHFADAAKEKASDAKKEKKVEKSTEVFDDGRLKLIGSMEYEGPDFENGSMEFKQHTLLKIQNISKAFLRNAVIEVKVNGKESMKLTIDSLPAGETVMAMGHGYEAFAEKDIFKVISCEASYEEQVISEKEGLVVAFENGKIQVQNQSAEDYSGLHIRYKGKVGDVLMGGNTYEFTVDSLAPGSSYETDSQSFLAESIQVVEVK